MKKVHFIFVIGALAILGGFVFLTKQNSLSTVKLEVPKRSSLRNPASMEEGTSSQVAALSIRPSVLVTGGLNITESQIHLMEENLNDLEKDVSLFKESEGWVVRFHHPSSVMTTLGVKDNDLISFKQLQKMKSEPALTALVLRLEIIFSQLHK